MIYLDQLVDSFHNPGFQVIQMNFTESAMSGRVSLTRTQKAL